MLKIGSLKLKSRFILAPMAGITDLPFRMLNRKFGCELAFVEMINVRSISYKSRKTQQMLSSLKTDRPLGVQLLGKERSYILRAIDILNEYKFDLLDFNAACPARKVIRRGEGAGLLKEPQKLKKILALVVKNSRVPVTVKIRIGWDRDSVNAREVALLAEDAGVQGIFIHGRTKEQAYSGVVDYETIRQVKSALQIPVIASGDIFSVSLAKKMFDLTECDGLAIARGALGNPWIFRELEAFFGQGRTPEYPGHEEIIRVMLEHLDAYLEFYSERIGLVKFRKFFAWYTKGFRKIRPLREKSSRAKTRQEMAEIIGGCRRLAKTP
ncbi:MAG: tRNA dihydrouridine synthase DusB [Candidatus Omnitrophica bacterium]|nr:tRNA dihydrouridine synthase DusB [Candidatus Omnitrophota bacterium]